MTNNAKAAASMGLLLALMAPMAMAQTTPTPNPHPHQHDKTKTQVTGNHDKVVNHDTTIQHQTIIAALPQDHPNQWVPNNKFLPGHAPGDNRLPIYTQQGLQHQDYPAPGGREWHRGDRYDGPREVVTDWDRYHVQRPPAGYEYVRNGNQLVLIAVASGVVADVLANALAQ